MKATNMFYPNALMGMYHKLMAEYHDHRYKPVGCLALVYLSPFVVCFLPIWYVLDVIANILDWVCVKLFVDLPLWGFAKAEEYERLYGK
jgi:hypothetical protein